MTDPPRTDRRWTSRLHFLLAAIGLAVGPGNVWRFPYLAGEHGGGAFVLLYLLAVTAVAVPILIAELMVGRRGRGSAPRAMRRVAEAEGRSRGWGLVAWLGLASTLVIVSFFSVIVGWMLAYLLKAASGSLAALTAASATATFERLTADPLGMAAWHGAVVAITTLIVARGLHRGVEAAARRLVPLLPVLLAVLIAHGAVSGDLRSAVAFLFAFELSAIDGETALAALGQAFLSIGVGGATMMTYGAYVGRAVSLPRAAITVAAADTCVALLAGLAIFPLVFAHGLDPSSGPGLVFVTYPLALSATAAGSVLGTAFFALLIIASLTSIVAAVEALVAAIVEHGGTSRGVASAGVGISIWLLGLGTVLSFNRWSDLQLAGKTVFELLDFLTLSVSVPLGALLLALFVAWRVVSTTSAAELAMENPRAFYGWLWTLRIVVPLALGAILVSNLG